MPALRMMVNRFFSLVNSTFLPLIVKAASEPGVSNPYIRLDIHSKSGFFMFCCENAANIRDTAKKDEEKTVPRHGLVLKIIQTVAERYSGLTDTEYSQDHYRIRVGIPLI